MNNRVHHMEQKNSQTWTVGALMVGVKNWSAWGGRGGGVNNSRKKQSR